MKHSDMLCLVFILQCCVYVATYEYGSPITKDDKYYANVGVTEPQIILSEYTDAQALADSCSCKCAVDMRGYCQFFKLMTHARPPSYGNMLGTDFLRADWWAFAELALRRVEYQDTKSSDTVNMRALYCAQSCSVYLPDFCHHLLFPLHFASSK